MLLNILQCTGQLPPPRTTNSLTSNVNNTEVEKPALNNDVMGQVVILRRTVPETLSSKTLHPVAWDGHTLKHSSDPQEILGQVTIQLQMVKLAITALCPIHSNRGLCLMLC